MTKAVKINNLTIGGGAPVIVQSMTNTPTSDAQKTIAQIRALEAAGCELVRCSVPDRASALALREITARVGIPVAADIHFDYKLAVLAAENGAAKIRINPGNIGGFDKVSYLAGVLKERGIPVRIGVNGGSLDARHAGKPLAEAMRDSALEHAALLERCGFGEIILSAKASDVPTTIATYRLLARACDYPLHLGVTEAGTYESGLVKSAIGIGSLLCDGIGDTIRVSLTDDPIREIAAGIKILRACGRYEKPFVEIVSCPTCARTCYDVQGTAEALERACAGLKKRLKIAVMGCVVNGIGESKGCDFGVAGGKDKSVIFKDGEILETVPNDAVTARLLELTEQA